jgi:hypothetical protein
VQKPCKLAVTIKVQTSAKTAAKLQTGPPSSITGKGSKEALDFCVPVTKEAQIVTKTLQIGSDN